MPLNNPRDVRLRRLFRLSARWIAPSCDKKLPTACCDEYLSSYLSRVALPMAKLVNSYLSFGINNSINEQSNQSCLCKSFLSKTKNQSKISIHFLLALNSLNKSLELRRIKKKRDEIVLNFCLNNRKQGLFTIYFNVIE